MEKTKLSVCGVITCQKKFLIVQRASNDDFLPSVWEFPGGSVETSETITDALIRELKEELGLDITANKKELIGFSEEFMDPEKTNRYLQMNYEIEFPNEPTITLSPEHVAYDWASPQDPRLDEFLKNIIQQAKTI